MGDWPPGELEAKRSFGRRVRTKRRAAGLTQEKLAERAGVHRTFITQIEYGTTSPTLWTIVRLAWGLDVPPGTLVDDLVDHPTRPAPAKSRRKIDA